MHERLMRYSYKITGSSTFFYYSWVIPGIVVIIILGLILIKFLFRLPIKTRIGFIISGCIFVGRAIGMEMIGGNQDATNGADNFVYRIYTCTEELMEMLGMLLFMKYLMIYLEDILRIDEVK